MSIRRWQSSLSATVRARHAVPGVLAIAGLVAVYLVLAAHAPTSKAVWIGVASTAFAASLVDASVQIEGAIRERAIIRVAAQRVARINRSVLYLLRSAYEIDVHGSDMRDRLDTLADDHEIDATKPEFGMAPDRTKGEWWSLALEQIDQDMDLAVTLGSLTYAAAQVERLEQIIRANGFLTVLRYMPPIDKTHRAQINQAALEVFEVMADLDFWFSTRR